MTSVDQSLAVDLVAIGVTECPPGARYGPKVEPTFGFVWLLEGTAEWHAGTSRSSLQPGDLLLVRAGMRSAFEWDRRRATHQGFADFRITAGNELLGPEDAWPLLRRIEPGGLPHVICDYVTWLDIGRSADERRLAEALVSLLVLIFVRGSDMDVRRMPLPGPIERVIHHARVDWSGGVLRSFTMHEMATVAGCSAGHLSRVFRAEFGLGPVATIERLRLHRAALLLRRTNMTVQKVAAVCGFGSPYYFSRRFRRTYGVPPRTYRTADQVGVAEPSADRLQRLERWFRASLPTM